MLGLVCGTAFGVLITAYGVDGDRLPAAALGGVLTAVPFGLAMGVWGAREGRVRRAALAEVGEADHRTAVRAAVRGPVPVEPAVRAAAGRLAAQRLTSAQRQRRWAAPTFGVAAATLAGMAAVTSSPASLIPAALFGLLLVTVLAEPPRLRRRVAALTAPEERHGSLPG